MKRSPAVFVVGFLTLVALCLPPLPISIRAVDLPKPLLWLMTRKTEPKKKQVFPVRLDYFIIPPLALYALWTFWKSRPGFEEAGLTAKQFPEAMRDLAIPMAVGAVLVVGIGLASQSIHWRPKQWTLFVPINGLIQQCAIQLFFHRQLWPWFGKGRLAAWMLTLFFVVLHLPNSGLMLGTLFGMYFWARTYQRFPNLYALALYHTVMSALVVLCFPKWLLPTMSVGWRFVEKGIKHNWWGWTGSNVL